MPNKKGLIAKRDDLAKRLKKSKVGTSEHQKVHTELLTVINELVEMGEMKTHTERLNNESGDKDVTYVQLSPIFKVILKTKKVS